MSLVFHNVRLSFIISIDFGLFNFGKDIENYLSQVTILGEKPVFEYKELSDEVYDHEFIRLSSPIPTLTFEIDNNIFFDNYVKGHVEKTLNPFYNSFYRILVIFSFDQRGIMSIRFDLYSKLDNSIQTPKMIEILDETCTLVDETIFPKFIKNEIEKLVNPPENAIFLQVHETYSIVSSVNVTKYKSKSQEKRDIFGIVWKEPDYNDMDEKTVDIVTKNEIGLFDSDIFTIATPASLLICEGDLELDSDYFNERINAVEIFCRQQHLLKKLDVKLDFFIANYNKKNVPHLKSVIEEIRVTKMDVYSALEFYRNTKIYGIHFFKILFDILNEVFELNKHYSSVLDKLNVCDDLYKGLHDERRNNLTENIQWLVVILGGSSLLVAVLNLFKDSYMGVILLFILLLGISIIQIRNPGKLKRVFIMFIEYLKFN